MRLLGFLARLPRVPCPFGLGVEGFLDSLLPALQEFLTVPWPVDHVSSIKLLGKLEPVCPELPLGFRPASDQLLPLLGPFRRLLRGALGCREILGPAPR